MAKKPRGGRGKRVAKSKIAKPKVPPRTAHPPEAPPPLDARLRSLAPSASEISSGLTEPILPPEDQPGAKVVRAAPIEPAAETAATADTTAATADTARAPQNIAAAGAFARGAFQADAFQVGVAETAVAADTPSATVPILIVPTIYPQEPGGTITVQNYITININSDEFRAFEGKMSQLLAEMGKSNAIAGEVRDKLNAEIGAGMTILKSPKPDRRVIEVWLLRPLRYIVEKAAGAVIGKLAGYALEMLGRVLIKRALAECPLLGLSGRGR
jgi:hypothetical protein